LLDQLKKNLLVTGDYNKKFILNFKAAYIAIAKKIDKIL
jgi:hypothetical protein